MYKQGKIINTGNWTEWSAIWSEIVSVISNSNEHAAFVRFEISSMISAKIARPKVQSPLYEIDFEITQICQTMAFLSFIFLHEVLKKP